MPPVETKFTFHAWQRQPIFDHVEPGAHLTGSLDLELTDAPKGDFAQGSSKFELLAAADIAALNPSAIRHMAPAPMTPDAEITKYVHVDLWEKDLPWRYTPKPNDPNAIRPWMVLLVGAAVDIQVDGGRAVIRDSVLKAHNLSASHLWAHTQFDGSVEFSRIVSPHKLTAELEHIAVLVPAFNSSGNDNWTVNGDQVVPAFDGNLPPPALFSWRFWTAEAGDFETLATALHIPEAGSAGVSKLYYSRVDKTLKIGGAITSLQVPPDETSEVQQVTADFGVLNADLQDENIISLPRYGRPWVPNPSEAPNGWAKALNVDPRHRAVAGLGTWMGVEGQESLIDAAVQQAGALREAGKIINHLATGLEAAGRLWERRLSNRAEEHLRVLGPMLGRIVTENKRNALETVTSGTSPLDPAYFSSAAQRIIRDRSSHTRYVSESEGGIDTAMCLEAANQPEPPPARSEGGLPHADVVSELVGIQSPETHFGLDESWRQWVAEILADVQSMIESIQDPQALADEFARYLDSRLRDKFLLCESREQRDCCRVEEIQRSAMGYDGDFVHFCRLLIGHPASRKSFFARLGAELQYCVIKGQCLENVSFLEEFAPEDVCRGIAAGLTPRPPPIHTPVDIGGLAGAIDERLDPRRPDAPARLRVCARLEGIDCSRLIPPEFAIGIDYPTWDLLRTYEKEWLLPGARSLEQDSITALRTNPAFIDAFMVGINSQFMSEMRWRDLAVDRYCTPLRMFWGQIDFGLHTRSADIEPFAEWAKDLAQAVGSLAHQTIKPAEPAAEPESPPGSRLVIAFRSNLFRRYPSTLVYVVRPANEAELNSLLEKPPEFDRPESEADVEAWRLNRRYFGPIFTGTINPEITFFMFDVPPGDLDRYWLVLDEPPSELRLRNDMAEVHTNAATFAASTLDPPTRVAISGLALENQGLQP